MNNNNSSSPPPITAKKGGGIGILLSQTKNENPYKKGKPEDGSNE